MRQPLTVALVALGLAGAAALGLALTLPLGTGARAPAVGSQPTGRQATTARVTGRWWPGARPPLREPDPWFFPHGLMSPNVITPRPNTDLATWWPY
jgi:hypothetical protein